jgi:predicted RNase H-like HicB family nuclease
MKVELHAVPIVYFEEAGVIIAYCVPLDVSSCGHTIEEARHNIHDAVEALIETCQGLGTLDEVLEESGFVKSGHNWLPPVLVNTDKLDVVVA